MSLEDKIKIRWKDEEKKILFENAHGKYNFSLKVFRVEKQNIDKIKNGNFVFLEGLKS